MFSNNELASNIQNTLNLGIVKIPDGHTIAVVVHADYDLDQQIVASAAFVVKVNDEWQVQTLVDWSNQSGVKAGLNIAWSR